MPTSNTQTTERVTGRVPRSCCRPRTCLTRSHERGSLDQIVAGRPLQVRNNIAEGATVYELSN
jgi:hypothetical protein